MTVRRIMMALVAQRAFWRVFQLPATRDDEHIIALHGLSFVSERALCPRALVALWAFWRSSQRPATRDDEHIIALRALVCINSILKLHHMYTYT